MHTHKNESSEFNSQDRSYRRFLQLSARTYTLTIKTYRYYFSPNISMMPVIKQNKCTFRIKVDLTKVINTQVGLQCENLSSRLTIIHISR